MHLRPLSPVVATLLLVTTLVLKDQGAVAVAALAVGAGCVCVWEGSISKYTHTVDTNNVPSFYTLHSKPQ